MSRKAAEVSPEGLWNIFQEKALQVTKKNEGDDATFEDFDRYMIQDIDRIGEDISKVQFDFENCDFKHTEEFGIFEGMLGYRSLYPLSYIGAIAGGDWEFSVYFIIYLDQDGKTLRAYVPKVGNVWNYNTKEAIGNDEDSDSDFLAKWAKANLKDKAEGVEYEDPSDAEIMFNKEAIRADIRKRIEVVRK